MERCAVAVGRAPHEELERGLRVLELEALVLQLLQLGRDLLRRRRRRIDLETELASPLDHVAAPALLADDDMPPVADGARIEMLVRPRVGGDRMDVDAALVSERRVADEGQPHVRLDVGDVVDVAGELRQAAELFARGTLDAELEHEVRDDRGEIRVPRALAVAVDRPLHLARTRGDRSERVRHRELAVVVRVDADGAPERADGVGDGLGDLAGERAAVRVAEDEPVGPRVGGSLQDGERIVAIRSVAVEEVLRVDHDLASVRLQVRDRVGDHRHVLVERRPQHGVDVVVPGLCDERDRRRLGVEQQTQPCIVLCADARVPRAAERAHPRSLQPFLAHGDEELRVLRVRTRPAALDVVDAELVQFPCDRELVVEGQRDTGALGAVAQRGVVDRDAIGHRRISCGRQEPTCRLRAKQAAVRRRCAGRPCGFG